MRRKSRKKRTHCNKVEKGNKSVTIVHYKATERKKTTKKQQQQQKQNSTNFIY